MTAPRQQKVCVGMITGAHGVRGLVKIRSFTADPAAITAYGPLVDETGGRHFAIEVLGEQKEQWLARIDGVADRTAAEALRGTRLHVDRACLPEPAEDEFYHADLIGLGAELPDGTVLGTVRAVHDFGAGDLLEVARPGRAAAMVPFTRRVVPVVDVAGGRLVIDPPVGLLEASDEPAARPVRAVTERGEGEG